MNMKLAEALVEITHLASQGVLADSEQLQLSALADIADEARRFLPDLKLGEQMTGSGALLVQLAQNIPGGVDGAEPATVRRSNLEIRPGVRLVRFRGEERTTLMAKINHDGARLVYKIEIEPEHDLQDQPCFTGSAYINDRQIFAVCTETRNRAEKLAVSCLHRWLKDNDRRNQRAHRQRKAKKGVEK